MSAEIDIGIAPWPGRTEEAEDVCALPLVRRLAALLDRDPRGLRGGEPLPTGWHCVLFTTEALQSSLGPDGHALTGGFLPALPLPRRMMGGRRTRFLAPVTIGAEVRRTSEIAAIVPKEGRTGRLAVVTVRHTIREAKRTEPAVIEEQDIIYREAASETAPAPAQPDDPARRATHVRAQQIDPVLLFRYSAVTFNGHRIHYDHPYATHNEGYPALVMNGGLTALLLLEHVKRAARQDPPAWIVRNRRPLFCGDTARLCAAPAGEGWTAWAETPKGLVAAEASTTSGDAS